MDAVPRRALSLFDSTSIIVGIIIGAGIYQMAPDIAKGVPGWWGVMAIWAVGGLLSLFGALGYAELATAYPKEGGDYVYLTHAYGRWAGFLFAWAQLTVVRPADIAVMAFAFAKYGRAMYDPLGRPPEDTSVEMLYAAVAVIILTIINALGVRQGKWTQNLLTCVKALGLLAIVSVAVIAPAQPLVEKPAGALPWSLALIFVLFTYGGWNEMAYVAAEVKNPHKNIIRALVVGMASVTGLYLLVNAAFMYVLGYNGLTASHAVATDVVSTVFTHAGGNLISALVCISALGAVNGLIFTGSRISYALGTEHKAFRLLGTWNERAGTPAYSLVLQGIIAVILIRIAGSFTNILLYSSVAVYSFYLATSISVIVLRFREPNVARPYKVTAYPLPTLIFAPVCAYLIYSAATYAWNVNWKSLLILAGTLVLGLAIYWATDVRRGREKGELARLAEHAGESPSNPQ